MNENEGWTQGVLHYYIALARSVTQQAETYRVPTYLDKIPLLLYSSRCYGSLLVSR